MKVFGEKLRELRTEKGISAKKLADTLGVSDSTVIRWENDVISPSIESLCALAKYFNVSADYLLGLDD